MQTELTHKQQLVWDAFLDEEYNEPSRTDMYLVQLAWIMERFGKKKGQSKSKFKDFVLKFGKNKKAKDPLKSMAASKASWFGITGAKRGKDG